MMYEMSASSFDLVYNVLSFSLASMAASTMFFWLRVGSVHEKYKSALVISGLVTFIAAYHYVRIFNSWTESYEFPKEGGTPKLTGKPFNDAYRYMPIHGLAPDRATSTYRDHFLHESRALPNVI
jgi:hypothetical protein